MSSPATSIPEASREAVLERVARFERDGLRVAVDATADNGYPAELRTDPARFAAFRARWLANDPVSFASIYRMLAAMDLTPEFAAIKCPVLVIGGEYDRGRPPPWSSRSQRRSRARQFKVLPTGHYAAIADAGADGRSERRVKGRIPTRCHGAVVAAIGPKADLLLNSSSSGSDRNAGQPSHMYSFAFGR